MEDPEASAREHVARVIADLSRPEAYPHLVDEEIALEETHASLAFLAGDYVYKVKKPVNFGFLDFSTLEQRRFFCHEELRLNRRLTRGVYLDVVPIVESGGRLQLFGEGPVLEYAVKMRRLPDDRVLDHLIETGQAEDGMFVMLADRLARFYPEAATGPEIDRWGTPDAIWFNIKENLDQTASYVGTVIAPIQHRLIDEVSRAYLAGEAELFQSRIARGWIREGHGDLHLRHIYVMDDTADDLQIIDCLEFNPRLRCGDVAVDVAFLAMDLAYHDRPDLAARVVELLAERLEDSELERLVQFYAVYRAHVRNKVACLRLNELVPELPEYFPVRNEAERYIDLATSYLVEIERPMLILVGGLSGTGKSVVSHRLARSTGAALVSSDVVRMELASRPIGAHEPAEYGSGIYTGAFNTRTYETLLDRVEARLRDGESVVADATFLDPHWRLRARDLAAKMGVDLLLFECQCPSEIVEERLARRARELFEPSEADWKIYQRQRERYGEGLDRLTAVPQVVLRTDRPSAQILEDVLARLPLRRRL